MPKLVQHFFEHQAENPDLGIMGFLQLHYSYNLSGHDQEDQKLPFKSHPEMAYSTVGIHFGLAQNLKFWQFKEASQKTIVPFAEFLYQSEYLSKIWQPPRVS